VTLLKKVEVKPERYEVKLNSLPIFNRFIDAFSKVACLQVLFRD